MFKNIQNPYLKSNNRVTVGTTTQILIPNLNNCTDRTKIVIENVSNWLSCYTIPSQPFFCTWLFEILKIFSIQYIYYTETLVETYNHEHDFQMKTNFFVSEQQRHTKMKNELNSLSVHLKIQFRFSIVLPFFVFKRILHSFSKNLLAENSGI